MVRMQMGHEKELLRDSDEAKFGNGGEWGTKAESTESTYDERGEWINDRSTKDVRGTGNRLFRLACVILRFPLPLLRTR